MAASADAVAVERTADATLRVAGRSVDWPGAAGQTFDGYRPSVSGPDVLWMEGTLIMRLAKARLGSDVTGLDASTDRWAALTCSGPAAPRRSRGRRGLPRVARGSRRGLAHAQPQPLRVAQVTLKPPSTSTIVPLIQPAAGLARYAIAEATSSASPRRRSG